MNFHVHPVRTFRNLATRLGVKSTEKRPYSQGNTGTHSKPGATLNSGPVGYEQGISGQQTGASRWLQDLVG